MALVKGNRKTSSRVRLLLSALLMLLMIGAACTPAEDEPVATSDPDPTEVPATAVPEDTSTTDTSTTDTGTTDTTADEPDDEPAAEPEPTEVPEVELTASWRGVTEDTITIGVSMLDFGILAELGAVTEGWGDQQLVWETYIDDLNARGGINGRMVEAHYSYYSPLGTEAAETSCVELTQDVETFAILGGFLGPASPANTCITAVNDTILVNGVITPEALEEATAPWVQAAALSDRTVDLFLGLLDAEGMVEGRNVVVVGSVEFADIVASAEKGLIDRGVTPLRIIENDVPQGDILGTNDAWSIYSERIASDGADTVLVIGSGQGAVRGISAAGLDVEVWVLNVADLSNLGAETPKEAAEGAITITGMTDQERWEHSITQECRATFLAAHPDLESELRAPNDFEEGVERWFNPITSYCSWLRIFEILATEAGPDLTHDSFAAAIERTGDFSTAGMPFASFGPGKIDASDSFRLGVFDQNASDTGAVVALTDILDATP